jgi:uncharacterized protein YdaU (DUF1376 family)
MNFYKHHIGDYRNEEPIPTETESVLRRLCAKTEEEKLAIQTVLEEFFTRTENGWTHTRCDAELREYRAKAGVARSNGKLGGRPRKTQSVSKQNQQKTEPVIFRNPDVTETKANHKPLTTNHKEKHTPQVADLFPDVSPEVLESFIKVRRSLRAPITELAATGIKREAAKAGITLEAALTMCVERSWRGFKAEWVKDKGDANGFDWDTELRGAI